MPLIANGVVITYGSWSTADSGYTLTGVHTIDQDERTFRLVFDVALHAANATALRALAGTMIDELNERHLTTVVSTGGVESHRFVDGVDGTPASGSEGAEFIMADWELLGEHRTSTSRAYRVTITVTRAANQPDKPGVFDQGINVTTLPSGQRRVRFRAQFTPGPDNGDGGTALARYSDSTHGFIALAEGVLDTLGGKEFYERSGSIAQQYDEDARTLTASATWVELLYPQTQQAGVNASNPDDAELVNVRYDIQVDRPPGYGVPGQVAVQPLSAVTVSFSAQVDTSSSKTLRDLIETVVVPYVSGTVSKVLTTSSADTKLMKHTLKADPVGNRVAGNLFYLVEETPVLELSKRTVTSYRRGISLVPVLDGSEFTRDLHTGPGRQTMSVVLGVRVLGRSARSTLDAIERNEVQAANRAGFIFLGYDVAHSASVESFFQSGRDIETTVQMSTLLFERAEIRPPRNIPAQGQQGGNNVGGTRVRVANTTSALGAGILSAAQKAISHQTGRN